MIDLETETISSALQQHWCEVYRRRATTEVSWFTPHLQTSLRLLDAQQVPVHTPVVDVGGGRSTLVDDLLARGFTHITVVDLAAPALEESRARLGAGASAVHWVCADVTRLTLDAGCYGVWHDRAVFHFLVDASARARYIAQATHAIAPGGYAIIATFASDGPERCSDLPVRRYDAAELQALFPVFEPVMHLREAHHTPTGKIQPFTYVVLRRRR